MPEPGRPTKLTPKIQERIIQAISLGNYRKDAAAFAGVDPATVHRWMVRGANEPQSEYGTFRRAVQEAEARSKVAAMGCVTKAARDGDWKAASWWLSRKYPHQYSDRSQLFLISKAFEQIEAAAEAAGTPLPDGVWETAWTNLAADLAHKLPSQITLDYSPADMDAELAQIDNVSEEERRALIKLLHSEKRNGEEVRDPSES